MMHGLGKSHSLIVPAKPPNEAGAEAKEAVEERRLAKGKTLKRNRFRTQSRQILSSTLERIREGEDGSEHRYHSYSSATSALSPEARAGCGNSARPDPCGGRPRGRFLPRQVPNCVERGTLNDLFARPLSRHRAVIAHGHSGGNPASE